MGDVEIIAIMRDMAEDRRNSFGDKWHSSWCNNAADEIERLRLGEKAADREITRLRAELAERDKAEGLCPTCVDALGPELARKCPAKPPNHPPRQAVPDRIVTLADVPAEIQDNTVGSTRAAYRQGWNDCRKAILTAAPEAEGADHD